MSAASEVHMRRWGIVITLFYGVVLLALLFPAIEVIAGESWPATYADIYRDWGTLPWLWAAALMGGQAVLFMRVDRSWRKLRPRTHVAITAAAMAAATAVLFLGSVLPVLAAIYGDKNWPFDVDGVVILLGMWGFWAVIFFLYYRGAPARMANLVRWLLTGSVLELLIAVPAHVIVRRRHDCSAPMLTGFGIVTGTAVMLMCFGPGVIALYQQRRQRYRAASSAEKRL